MTWKHIERVGTRSNKEKKEVTKEREERTEGSKKINK
jgi:hypothetical protein